MTSRNPSPADLPHPDGRVQPPLCPAGAELANFLANRTEPLHAHYRINAGYIPLNHWTQDPQQGGGRIIGEGCHFVDFLTFWPVACPSP